MDAVDITSRRGREDVDPLMLTKAGMPLNTHTPTCGRQMGADRGLGRGGALLLTRI